MFELLKSKGGEEFTQLRIIFETLLFKLKHLGGGFGTLQGLDLRCLYLFPYSVLSLYFFL